MHNIRTKSVRDIQGLALASPNNVIIVYFGH